MGFLMAGLTYFSHGDPVPLGRMSLRRGATYRQSWTLTQVDYDSPDTEIAPKDYSNYTSFQLVLKADPWGSPIATVSATVTVQGSATDGILRLVIPQAEVTTLCDAIYATTGAGYAIVMGLNSESEGDPDGTLDPLFAFQVDALPGA